MVVTTVRGTFTGFTGQIEVENDDPTTARGEVVISTASVNTGVADRDNHLRGADFFDAEKFPEMRFTSTAVEPLGGDRYTVRGDLTIKGVTRPVELRASVAPAPVIDPWGNRRTAISLEGEINRKDWGLTWNMALEAGAWLVSDTIKLTLDVAALKRVPATV
jgi:polyisoprenoid-binding protein YceI